MKLYAIATTNKKGQKRYVSGGRLTPSLVKATAFESKKQATNIIKEVKSYNSNPKHFSDLLFYGLEFKVEEHTL